MSMGRWRELEEFLFPSGGIEAGECGLASDDEGSFDEVPVFGEQPDGCFFGHGWEVILQTELPIVGSRGVEKFSDVTLIGIQRVLDFLFRGWCFANGPHLVVEFMALEPVDRVAAGAAVLVCVNDQHGEMCRIKVKMQVA